MSTAHPMVEKAARAWCKRHAEACGLDEATLWAEREAGFITEAQAALEACGAMELLDLARRFASECGDCAGTRVLPDDDDEIDEIGSLSQSAEALRITAAAPVRNTSLGGDYDG